MCATEQSRIDTVPARRRSRPWSKIAGVAALAVFLLFLIFFFLPVPSGFAGRHVVAEPVDTAATEPARTAIACGTIALPRSIGAGDVVAIGHLPGRSYDFVIGLKDAYASGKLTVSPGIICRGNRVGFNLFGGVSREKEYFDLKMTAGHLQSPWSYLEQWLIEEKVTFDNGTTVAISDPLLGAEVPAGARRIVRIEMRMWSGRDQNGHDSETTLTWE